MASFNRPRFFPPDNNGGFRRNYFEQGPMDRNLSAMNRNYDRNSSVPFQRYPFMGPSMGPFASGRHYYPEGNEQMRGAPLFRGPRSMGGEVECSGYYDRPYFEDESMYRNPASTSRMRMNYNSNERFFVPWNQRPQNYTGNRLPSRKAQRASRAANKPAATTTKTPRPRRKRKSKKYVRKEDGRKLKPWMTDEIFAEVKKKNDMYVKAKDGNDTSLWQEFRLQRNRVSSLVKEAKLKGGFIIRKVKEESDDRTERPDRPFSCDTCDRAFVSEADLAVHVKDHVKCGVKGCEFEAHTKVVDLHRKMQHETGYADVIMKLNNPDEVEKWRNERRSHYPTAENIKKRKAEQEEKVARGEVLETKDFGSRNEKEKDLIPQEVSVVQEIENSVASVEDKEDEKPNGVPQEELLN